MKTRSASSSDERRFLFTLAAVQFTNVMDFMIMMPLGPQLMRLFQIQPAQFGAVVSSYSIASGISGFCAAFYMDRFDRKSLLSLLYVGFLLGTLACALAPTFHALMGARIIAGIFGGVIGALVNSIVADAIPAERRGRAMGIVAAAFSVASVVGVPFGLFIASKSSWHAPFFLLAATCGVIQIAIHRYIPAMRGHLEHARAVSSEARPGVRRNPLRHLSELTAEPAARFALILTFFVILAHFPMIPFLSPSMVANVGFTEDQLACIYMLGGGATIFTSPLIGRLADRRGPYAVFKVFAFVALVPIFVITHLGRTALPLALLITTLFFICGNGRFVPAMALVTGTVPPQKRGSFMSINSSVQALGSGLASLLAGVLVTRDAAGHLVGYPRVAWVMLAATLTAIWTASRVHHHVHSRTTITRPGRAAEVIEL